MQFTGFAEVRAQARRAAVELLLEDPFVEEADNMVVLDGILDNHATADTRLSMWRELMGLTQWLTALEDGADVGRDDDGRPEDPELVKEQVAEQIEALLTSIACIPHPTFAALWMAA
jgi:hypothetical protein